MALVEQLIVLRHHSRAVLGRLGWAFHKCAGPSKLSLFSDKNYERVFAAIDKKFPALDPSIEKASGFSDIKGKAKIFYEELEPHYNAIVDAYQFKELASSSLVAAAQATTEFLLDNNPNLTEVYFDVLCDLGKVVALVHQIQQRKVIVVLFAKLFKFVKQNDEPNFAKVSKWIAEWEQVPFQHTAKVFAPVADKLGRSLSLHLLNFSRARTVASLRKEGTLNITHKPEEISKAVTDLFHLQLHLVPKIFEWVQWTCLVAPDAGMNMGDLAKTVLSDSWMLYAKGGASIDIHHELHHLTERVKSRAVDKIKKLPKDTVGAATSSGKVHRERRVFLRQEISQLYSLMCDQPALLGPKFPLVLAGLAMARDEIMVFFRHADAESHMLGKKAGEVDTKDKRISDLLWLVVSFRDLIRLHSDIITGYFAGYLVGADSHALRAMADSEFQSAVGEPVMAICRDVIEQISSAQPEGCDFRTMRLNWSRAEAAMTGAKQNMPLSKIKRTVDRFNLAIYHSRLVDDLEGVLDEYASLSEVYFFGDQFLKAFGLCVKEGPVQSQHTVAMLRMVGEFPSVAIAEDDQKEIGATCQKMAEKMIGEICSRVVALLHETAKKYGEFDDQVDPNHATYDMVTKGPAAKVKTILKQTGIKPPIAPGSESAYRARDSNEKLRLYERNAWQLCSALSEIETLSIFQTGFAPRDSLRERIGERLSKFIRSKATITYFAGAKNEVAVLNRPSVLLVQVRTYAAVLKTIEDYVDVDVDAILRQVLLAEFFAPPLANLPSFGWCDAEDAAFKELEGSAGWAITDWYARMLRRSLIKPGVVYSESRRSFIEKSEAPIVKEEGGRVEYLTDSTELRALCEMGGANLVTLIEREVLKFVAEQLAVVKVSVNANKNVLEDFAGNYRDERKSGETLKKLKDPEPFVQASVAIGSALSFRRLLLRCLGDVTEERAPLIHSTSTAMFTQYRQNTFMAKELLPSDGLAHICGVDLGSAADQPLKKFIAKVITKQDHGLWNLLHVMFAVSFYAPSWKTASFKAAVDAHENNVGMMGVAAAEVLVALKAVTSTSDNEKEITNVLQNFLEMSATVLLRIGRGHQYSKTDKLLPVSLPSMMIFLDQFVERCPLVSRDGLEQIVPYSLLVGDWHQVLDSGVASRSRELPTSAAAMVGQATVAAGGAGKEEDVF